MTRSLHLHAYKHVLMNWKHGWFITGFQLTDSKTEVLVFTTPSSAGKHNLTGVIGVSILKPTTQQTYKYWANAGVIIYILASNVCTVAGTNGNEPVHWSHRDKSLCTCLFRPSIGPIVSAQHWPTCIGPALARLYRPSIGPIPASFNIIPQDVAGEVFPGKPTTVARNLGVMFDSAFNMKS